MKALLEIMGSKKFKLGIIAIIVIGIIIFMFTNMQSTEPEEEKPEEPKEIVIDGKLEQELERKIKLLKYESYCDITSTSINIYNKDCLYRKNETIASDLNEQYRLYVLTLAKDEVLGDKSNAIVGRIKVDGIEFKNTQQFSLANFEKDFKELYGQNEPFNPLNVNQVNKFPYVKYDETRKKVFYQTTGENKEYNPNYVDEYIRNYESDEENVYIYVAVAYIAPKGSGVYGVYTEPEQKNLVDNLTQSEYEKKEIITDLNASKFTEFKYTFTKDKDSDNLIFNKVEKVV